MTRRCAPVFLALFGLATVACGGDAPAATSITRDSAGITIVENTGEPIWDAGEEWRVDSVPAVRIGGGLADEEAYLFESIRSVLRLPDGRIVVADGGANRIRFYDARGEHVRTVGREGGGPGEFGNLAGAHLLPGDSLLAYDNNQRRLSIFTASGDFVRSARIDEGIRFPMIVGAFDDGTLLARRGRVYGMGGTPAAGVSRDTAYLLRISLAGEVMDSLGQFPAAEVFVATRGRGGSVSNRAFGPAPRFEPMGHGVLAALNERWQIVLLDSAGVVKKLIRKPHEPVAVTQAAIDHHRERSLALSEPRFRAFIDQSLQDMDYAETFPPHGDVRVDASGHIWVQEFPSDTVAAPRKWWILDPDGRLLGTTVLPANLWPHQIGDNYVLGVERDDLDVQQVVLYRLHKPPGR